jgi:hypothetical protein
VICFNCEKELDNVFPDESQFEDYKQPNNGLVFTATGNYGSRVYDPVSTSTQVLVIWICDDCIRSHAVLVQMRSFAEVRREVIWKAFDPDAEFP